MTTSEAKQATFEDYLAARNETTAKAQEAKTAVQSVLTAEAAMANAQETLSIANDQKMIAFEAWEAAEQAENQLAEVLGIDTDAGDPPVDEGA